MNNKRRTQAERRAETHRQVLESACRLFGEHGYNNTSLEDIATDCGVTTRPIYHYFGNKKALFSAVNQLMEQRIINAIDHSNPDTRLMTNWLAFLELCDDPGFRRIVLLDSPNVLGRERWGNSEVAIKALNNLQPHHDLALRYRTELMNKMIMGAFTEAALLIAEAENIELAKQQASDLIELMFTKKT